MASYIEDSEEEFLFLDETIKVFVLRHHDLEDFIKKASWEIKGIRSCEERSDADVLKRGYRDKQVPVI